MKCLLSIVATVLVFSQIQACSSSSEEKASCWVSFSGCACRDKLSADEVAFTGTCDENGVGKRGICCQGDTSCYCLPVSCGVRVSDGICMCGIGSPGDYSVETCDGTASTCCTQDTGYCYCEEGCQNRFANRLVDSCNITTTTATCEYGPQVTSCE